MRQAFLLSMLTCCTWSQQPQPNFIGGAIGVTTLSADGQTAIAAGGSSVSLYKPENGITTRFYVGRHLSEYFSLQGNYTLSRNALTLTSLNTLFTRIGDFSTSGVQESVYEQMRASSQQMLGLEAMGYFRPRTSALRPYLSFGGGLAHFSSRAERVAVQRGTVALPPSTFSATKPFVRVDVGIDMRIKSGWKFRYSFGETITRNPISVQLTPQGKRNLATFQNLFGFVKEF